MAWEMQKCPFWLLFTLPQPCGHMDCSLPGTFVHGDCPLGILQARILEWVAIPSSRGSSQPRDWTQVCIIAGGFFTIWATREAKNTGVCSLSLLQGNLPDPGIKLGSPALQADSLPAELSADCSFVSRS